ncbi:MAG: radical SAM protein [Defluviitaleaceae bacterium]|nr:radical SAM protein [Defluviitaleaceae bacterium]
MALIFNNLIINKNSNRFQPFLFNLVSGRRKLLTADEFKIICSIMTKQSDFSLNQPNQFNQTEQMLFDKLKAEKQFFTDEDRNIIEAKILKAGYFDIDYKQADEFTFTIELTRNCNMRCVYCYIKPYINNNMYLTKNHIDAIYNFYHTYSDDPAKIDTTPIIGITGGEPLSNDETVELINYIVSKWPESKLKLLTNGVNLLKYYNKLPLKSIESVSVSLDGPKEIHLERRYHGLSPEAKIYDDIIKGIKILLENEIAVKVSSVIDKSNYHHYKELMNLLFRENISCSPLFEHDFGLTLDYSHPLDIDCNFNTKEDVYKIKDHFFDLGMRMQPLFLSSSKLFEALGRSNNEPMIPKHQRCNSSFLANYYFACDGNVYFCDCVDDGKGVVGTYFPNISVDKDIVSKLQNRSTMNNDKCRICPYKFVCLGGCLLSARKQNKEMVCGIYEDEEILDNLEFNYYWITN